MIKINWKKFEIKNPKATEAFETLCYFLFCRKFNITEGIRTSHSHTMDLIYFPNLENSPS